jgi:hypothetical protein
MGGTLFALVAYFSSTERLSQQLTRVQAFTGVPDNCDQGVPPRITRSILKLMIVSLRMINVDLFREIVPRTTFLLY